MTTKYCDICKIIKYDDEPDCDCYSPEKIKDREEWAELKRKEHEDWLRKREEMFHVPKQVELSEKQ